MKNNTKQAAVVAGVTVSMAALAAAGYFVFGPQGKKNRKQIKGWSLKMKGDVLEKLEKLKDVTPEVYNGIIDEVSAKYGKVKNISADEIGEIAMDLKKHWRAISRDMKAQENKTRSKVGGVKKKIAKKVSTKKVERTAKVAKQVAGVAE